MVRVLDEVLFPHGGRQIAKRSLAVPALAGALDGARARVACQQFDRHALEPAGFREQHGQRQRLLARGARHAPDPQRPSVQRPRQLRHDVVDDRAELIDLPPEVGLVDGERVHDVGTTRPRQPST